jgi:hypothetical protein
MRMAKEERKKTVDMEKRGMGQKDNGRKGETENSKEREN